MKKQLDEHTCDKIPKLYSIRLINKLWALHNDLDITQYNIPINNCPFCGEEL